MRSHHVRAFGLLVGLVAVLGVASMAASASLTDQQIGRQRAKDAAIEEAREASPLHGVVAHALRSERGESDAVLEQDVVDAIRDYEYYTVFDFVQWSINDGVVTLTGQVTATPDKKGDLGRRVARVRGVRELHNDLEILAPSRGDQALRRAIGDQVFTHRFFERFADTPNPPYHIIVHDGVVSLVGVVQSRVEKLTMESIARERQGVLRVENRLKSRTEGPRN